MLMGVGRSGLNNDRSIFVMFERLSAFADVNVTPCEALDVDRTIWLASVLARRVIMAAF